MAAPTTITSDDGNATVSVQLLNQNTQGQYVVNITAMTPANTAFAVTINGETHWAGQARTDDQG